MKRMNMNMRRITAFGIAALAGCWMAGLAISPASASIIISNLSQPQRSGGTVIPAKAIAFTMPTGSDYRLGNVTLYFDTYVNNPAATVSLYSNDANSSPGTKLLDFVAPASLVDGLNIFTPAAPFTLVAGTQYWLTVEQLKPNASFVWEASNNRTITSDIGATLGGGMWGTSSPDKWWNTSSVANYLQIQGVVVPEPATLALLALGGFMLIPGRKRLFH